MPADFSSAPHDAGICTRKISLLMHHTDLALTEQVPLFRAEALRQRTDRLIGGVSIAVPVHWQAISYLIFGGVLAAILFLSLATYSRVEIATGTIEPNKGVAAVTPTRSGTVTTLYVGENQRVAAGALLASIRVEESAAGNSTSAAQIGEAIARQGSSLSSQIDAVAAAASAQRQQLAVQRDGLESEISEVQSQLGLQAELVESAQKDYDRVRTVAVRGFISGRDLQQREDLILSRKQQLAQLQQSLASKRAELLQLDRNSAQLKAQTEAEIANISASRASVDQQAASNRGGQAYVLRAPVAGTVTAIVSRPGQSISPQLSMMSIVPEGSTLQAQLSVPASAIGFVKPGMEVRLAVDAFPYERFGTVEGKVLTVASAAISRAGPNGGAIAAFPVTITVKDPTIFAYGRRERLMPGMTVTARIVSERQSLMQWLFNPLFAVRKR